MDPSVRCRRVIRRASVHALTWLTLVSALVLPVTAGAVKKSRVRYDPQADLKVKVDFHVTFAFVPNENEVKIMEYAIQGAHRILCDATDGRLGFGKVELSAGAAALFTADVIVMPPGLWQTSTSTGFILKDTSRVYLMHHRLDRDEHTQHLMAHEMAHAILDLPDSYSQQSRRGRFWGIGSALALGHCSSTGRMCWTDDGCESEETCNHDQVCQNCAPSPQVNSLMGNRLRDEPGYVCATLEDGEGNPVPCATDWDCRTCLISEDPCQSDEDCLGFDECEAEPSDFCPPHPYYSEFLRALQFDPIQGDETICPEDRPGRIIEMRGRISNGIAAIAQDQLAPFDGSTWADADESAAFAPRRLRFIDEVGQVQGYEVESSHEVVVYFEHVDRQERRWRLHFLMDERHLEGPQMQAGKPHLLATHHMDFNGGEVTYPPTGETVQAARLCTDDTYTTCEAAYPYGIDNTVYIPTLKKTEDDWLLELDVTDMVLRESGARRQTRDSTIVDDDRRIQRGNCMLSVGNEDFCNDVCKKAYNSQTDRWEKADENLRGLWHLSGFAWASEWDRIASLGKPSYNPTVDNYHPRPEFPDFQDPKAFNSGPQWGQPSSLPEAEPPAACLGTFEIDINIDNLIGTDGLVLVLDTSGSMKKDHDVFGESMSRIDWAKSATRAIADLIVLHNEAVDAEQRQMLGLVSFATTAASQHGLEVLDPTTLSGFITATNGLTPGGNTALASGIRKGADMIAAEGGIRNGAILVMTDGLANVCEGESERCQESPTCECWDDPIDDAWNVVRELHDDHAPSIPVIFVPLGAEMGMGVFGNAVQDASGEVLHAETGRDLAVQFVRSYLKVSGLAPTLDAVPMTIDGGGATQPIPVEIGAGTLTILATSRDAHGFQWHAEWELEAPGGPTYDAITPGPISVYDDPGGSGYRIWQVAAPQPGWWDLRLFPTVCEGEAVPCSTYGSSKECSMQPGCMWGATGPVCSGSRSCQQFSLQDCGAADGCEPAAQQVSLMAWTNSLEPGCEVAAHYPVVYDAEADVPITVTSKWGTAVDHVEYYVWVERPDGSTSVQVPVEQHPDGALARGVFPASELHGRGTYRVRAVCSAWDPWLHPGEFPPLDLEEPPGVSIPEFHRSAVSSFLVDIEEPTWLPEGGDCNGDGSPDGAYGASCIAGWSPCQGHPNVSCTTFADENACLVEPGCVWFCSFFGCTCRDPSGGRSCNDFDEQDCGAVDGCDWIPFPCPPDPSSPDTTGNGVIDACDPDPYGDDGCAGESETGPSCSELDCCAGLTCTAIAGAPGFVCVQ